MWSAAQVMSSLKALYAAGGRLGRSDSDWAGAEPRPPVHGHAVFHWGYNDMIVGEMAQAHLTWEPTLEYTPKWAQEHRPNVLHLKSGRFVTPLPPAKNSTYAAYATAFMRRYGAHGSFWAAHRDLPYRPVKTVEVWNEPDNNHNWGPDVNLQDYAKLYEAARTAIHRVNRGTRVMTGGLAWTQSSLPRLLKAFEGKPIDAVAVHAYGRNSEDDDRAGPLRALRDAQVRARQDAADRQRVRVDLGAPHLGLDEPEARQELRRTRRSSACPSCGSRRSCRLPGRAARGV